MTILTRLLTINYLQNEKDGISSTLFPVLLQVRPASAQWVGAPPEYIISLTAQWEGERLPDGRPRVPDRIIERLKKVYQWKKPGAF
jgi:hypothetical protein